MTIRAGSISALVSAAVWISLVLFVAAESSAQSTEAKSDAKAAPANSPANNVAVQPSDKPLPAPFTLTPAEQTNLDQLLKDWETASNSIKTFKCKFTRMEYDPALVAGNPNQPSAVSKGELKYATPDKGMFKVTGANELFAESGYAGAIRRDNRSIQRNGGRATANRCMR